MLEQRNGAHSLRESGLCEHGNTPGNCANCQRRKETQPDILPQPYRELDQAHEVVKKTKDRYQKIKIRYNTVRDQMSVALERRNQLLIRIEETMDQPGEHQDEMRAEEIEIAELEAKLQMEERYLYEEMTRAMDQWMVALQHAQDAYIRIVDPEVSTMKDWLGSFYQKRLLTTLDKKTLQQAGYQFESLPNGLSTREIRDLLRQRTNEMEDIIFFKDGTMAVRKPIDTARRDALVQQGYEVIRASKNPVTRRQQLDTSIAHGDDIYLTKQGFWVIKRAEEQE